MANDLEIGPALGQANRLFVSQPLVLCMPLTLMYFFLWAIQHALQAVFPRGHLFLFLVCCGLLPLVEFWVVVLVCTKALPPGQTQTMVSVAGSVNAVQGLGSLIFRLYARLCGWSLAATTVAGGCGLAALVLSFMVHPLPRHAEGAHHASHPTAAWLIVMFWSFTLAVLLSRYMFTLPLVALLRQAPAEMLPWSIGLARRYRALVIATAFAQSVILTFPISTLEHFSRPHLEPLRFAWPTMQLAAAVLSGIGATWFILLKLNLAQQAWSTVNSAPVGS
jgi:hypothetical protein